MIDLSKCTFDESVSYGDVEKVFYSVPVEEIKASGIFDIEDYPDLCGGEIEFFIDEDGEISEEVLIWICVDGEDGISDADFAFYFEDITVIVDDYKNKRRQNKALIKKSTNYFIFIQEGEPVVEADVNTDVLARKAAKAFAFNDCYNMGSDYRLVLAGVECRYVGWQPGMLYTFVNKETGDKVWEESFPEWNH